jgi:hypothetical protein
VGEPDCAQERCTAPFTASTGTACEPCGARNEACCPSESGGYCGAGSVCNQAVCAECGGSGEPCCLGASCSSGGCVNARCPL